MTADVDRQALALAAGGMLIDGRWAPARSGGELRVEDPATQETLGAVPDASPEDGVAALDAAVRAQRAWAATAPRARSEILHRGFEKMVEHRDQLARLITLENGKPLAEAAGEITYASEFLRWFAEEAVRIDGRYTVAPDGRSRLLVTRQPVGPCLLITPWNFPAAMITRKVGAAIAAGCTMVAKPPSETPFTALALARLLEAAGLPAGVLNVITTSRSGEVVSRLMSDTRLRKISFTGSTEVGRVLLRSAADNILRSSMELGGNAPFLVFPDADLEAAVEGAMIAKMRNMGEACTSANRFYVAQPMAADFSERLADRMGALRLGRGTEPESQVGPLINEAGRTKVGDLVGDMVERGGRLLIGGERVQGAGYFYQPTVVTGVSPTSRALREEIFGPVAPIVTFDDEDSALNWANDSEFGLVAYVYTRDLGRAVRVAERLEYGMVGVNTGLVSNPAAPFGGVKQSGIGREGGAEGIAEYLETKYVALGL
ncbi:MAG: NAD-dependent succinate-semialdehyde dehydrogenase [Candidatus Dormibacteraeota bacterium]|nr:NAD-dependent succinate-semialdehyde dehydrogenase [Candidatus Dormibacteraeota bacterium]